MFKLKNNVANQKDFIIMAILMKSLMYLRAHCDKQLLYNIFKVLFILLIGKCFM